MEEYTLKTRKLLQIVLLVVAVVAAVPIGWAVQVQAQGTSPAGPTAGAQQIEGKITALDAAKRMLTLDDGTRLTIPPSVQLLANVKEGAMVKASFEERAGQKVLTGLEVETP